MNPNPSVMSSPIEWRALQYALALDTGAHDQERSMWTERVHQEFVAWLRADPRHKEAFQGYSYMIALMRDFSPERKEHLRSLLSPALRKTE